MKLLGIVTCKYFANKGTNKDTMFRKAKNKISAIHNFWETGIQENVFQLTKGC